MKRSLAPCVLALAAAAALSTSALAADAPPSVKYRQATMKALGGHMSGASSLLKGEVDAKGHLAVHMDGVVATGKLVKDLFPAGSDKGDTEALPAVWDKAADFKKAVGAMDDALGRLAAAKADPEAQKNAFGDVGKTCKGCHDGFRKKK